MTTNEGLLHYAWKFKLYRSDELKTTDDERVEVIDPGVHNTNSGPDFFNAKIKIGDKLWAGNVEIHRSADEWKKHRHHTDKAYNSVILHVVENANAETLNEAGRHIPQLVLRIPENVQKNADYLLHSAGNIPCKNQMSEIPKSLIHSWLSALSFERLERKTNDIFGHLQRFNNSWDETFYVMLCRNFGFGLNSDEFERLALSLPYSIIQKHADDIFQLEALLFGQAGILEEEIVDSYFLSLKKEYDFLRRKYSLKNLDGFLFKKLRVRPQSFPQIRIAQLAALFHTSGRLFSTILEKEDYNIRLHFHVNASDYWQTHYSFGKETKKTAKYPGDSSLNIILINTVAPILFAYGKKTGVEKYCERAISILESMKPERNTIVIEFSESGIKPAHALDSQALIQLRKEYCDKRNCLYCRIGHKVLSKEGSGGF